MVDIERHVDLSEGDNLKPAQIKNPSRLAIFREEVHPAFIARRLLGGFSSGISISASFTLGRVFGYPLVPGDKFSISASFFSAVAVDMSCRHLAANLAKL